MTSNSYNERVRFWPISRDVQKVTKKRQLSRSCLVCYLKKEHFLSNWGPRMSRKNDLKNQNGSEILQQKGRFLADFMRCPKSDKKMTILKLNKAKKSAFFATKKNVTKSRSCRREEVGPAGRPRVCNFVAMSIWKQHATRATSNAGCLGTGERGGRENDTPMGTRKSASRYRHLGPPPPPPRNIVAQQRPPRKTETHKNRSH